MLRSLLSLMLAVAFAFQGVTNCAMAETAAAAPPGDHCAEMAAGQSGSTRHQMPDSPAPHDCKHGCHLPAIAAPPALVAELSAAPEVVATTILAVRHGGETLPAIPPPRAA